MRFLNSVTVPKNVKGGTLCDFLTSIVLQNIETKEGGTLWCNPNKTRTPQVGAISKAQKAQNIFLEKNLKFTKKIVFRKMSHSAEKCKRGDPF